LKPYIEKPLSEIELLSIAIAKQMADIAALPNSLLAQAFEIN
jgi:hypothetical protein